MKNIITNHHSYTIPNTLINWLDDNGFVFRTGSITPETGERYLYYDNEDHSIIYEIISHTISCLIKVITHDGHGMGQATGFLTTRSQYDEFYKNELEFIYKNI